MKKGILTTNYILLILLALFTMSYDIFDMLLLKWAASTCFVVLAFVNFFYVRKTRPQKTKVALIMLIGMVLAMGGDVSINFSFIAGAAVFAMGHVFYLITYCVIEGFRKSDFALTFVFLAGLTCFLFATPIFDFEGLDVIIFAYCIIISAMAAKAVMNAYRDLSKSNLIFACGSVMFLISDIMLVLNLFAETSNITHILCHSIYFPGQWVLAYGMYHLATEKKDGRS